MIDEFLLTPDMFSLGGIEDELRSSGNYFSDNHERRVALWFELLRRNPKLIRVKYESLLPNKFEPHNPWAGIPKLWQFWIMDAFEYMEYNWDTLKTMKFNSNKLYRIRDFDNQRGNTFEFVTDYLKFYFKERLVALPKGYPHEKSSENFKKNSKVSKDGRDFFYPINNHEDFIMDSFRLSEIESRGYKLFAINVTDQFAFEKTLDFIKTNRNMYLEQEKVLDTKNKRFYYDSFIKLLINWNKFLKEWKISHQKNGDNSLTNFEKQLNDIQLYWDANNLETFSIPLTTYYE